MGLKDAEWLARPGVATILAALGPGAAQIVGGAVRDTLLGLPVSDIDLATPLPPAEVMRRLAAAGLRSVPTGIAHGTVTALAAGAAIEVTTLRRDVATDGRHAEVAFTDDWREDASRRDFTINALYADPASGEISDWFGGLEDLAARRVRFIGEPLQRIAEDHLRILRFFRFHARFAKGAPDPTGLAACAARANDLMALSRERVRDELSKLLAVADPVPTVATMLAHRVLRPVLPEIIGVEKLTGTVTAEAASGLPANWVRRLGALFPPDAALLGDLAGRLRLSGGERRRLALLAEPLGDNPRATAYRGGVEGVVDRLLIAGRDREAAVLAGWTPPRLPASGRDLIARGVPPGPEVSRRLGDFERAWIAQGFPTDPARLATLLDAAAAG